MSRLVQICTTFIKVKHNYGHQSSDDEGSFELPYMVHFWHKAKNIHLTSHDHTPALNSPISGHTVY